MRNAFQRLCGDIVLLKVFSSQEEPNVDKWLWLVKAVYFWLVYLLWVQLSDLTVATTSNILHSCSPTRSVPDIKR